MRPSRSLPRRVLTCYVHGLFLSGLVTGTYALLCRAYRFRDPKALVIGRPVGCHTPARGRAARPSLAVPAASADNSFAAAFGQPGNPSCWSIVVAPMPTILHRLRNVAEHVVKAEGIGGNCFEGTVRSRSPPPPHWPRFSPARRAVSLEPRSCALSAKPGRFPRSARNDFPLDRNVFLCYCWCQVKG
jgi:hypothetical protein